jgi:hypothetical protein
VNLNRRKFFGGMTVAAMAAVLPKSEGQTIPVVPVGVIVRLNGSTVGLFTTLADAQTYVSGQTTPSSYSVEVWPITPAGQSNPLNGSNL